jgi:GDP-4-dehydro-6-deoxy-D-mannose reductase
VRLLVTGADGFVGQHLVRRLARDGHHIGAGCRPGGPRVDWAGADVIELPLELTDDASVRRAVEFGPDAVVHLAAVASNPEALADPGFAWSVNAAGTARLAEAIAGRWDGRGAAPRLLIVSSGEVYGPGSQAARKETDALAPATPYASSKAGAELAGLEVWRRTGLPVLVARPFTHTGPGQDERFVLPSFVARLRAAHAVGERRVRTGNLEPVRDLLDVRDVAEAYVLLLRAGEPGEVYNVARGEGTSVGDMFRRLAEMLGISAEAEPDPALARRGDIPHLVGDPTKLRRATGWAPARTLQQTLRGLLDAEAD